MKKLREIVQINEIGDSHYSLNQDYTGKNTSMSHFYTNSGNRIQIHIKNSKLWPHKADVNFSDINGFDMNNSEPRTAHRVFGTIRKAISQHLEAFPETTHITFGSKKEEPSRTKLYHHFARSVDPDYTHHEMDMGTEFSMNVGKLKEQILVTEIGDSHYPFYQNQEFRERPGTTNKKFRSKDGQEFEVFIRNTNDQKKRAIVTFDNRTHNSDEVTHTSPKTAHRVFGTVKKIIQHHIENNPNTQHIYFSSKNDEPSRLNLYHKFATHLDPDYQHDSFRDNTDFTVNVDKLRK